MEIVLALSQYVLQFPTLGIFIIGVILSLSHRRRNPNGARLALIAFSVFLAASLVFTPLSFWLPFMMYERSGSAYQLGIISTIVGFIRSSVSAVAFGLLLFAIFGTRQKANIFCPNCGSENSSVAQFCNKYGNNLPSVAEPRVEYAGFGKRFFASVIDSILMTVLGFIIGTAVGLMYARLGGGEAADVMLGFAAVLGFLIGLIGNWLYFALLESSRRQATLGKRPLGIRVTDMQGNRISFGRASGRYFGKYVSTLILLIGYIMAAFTEKKQALHDKMAGTLVMNA